MSDDIWTDEQVAQLNAFQRGPYHPYTCGSGDRMDEAHRKVQAERGGDFGELVATRKGWVCPACDYTQDMAGEFLFRVGAKLLEPKP